MEKLKTFFDGDLDEAEADRLEAAILADPDLAQGLTEEAGLRYKATGSPEPSWASRRPGRTWAWGGLAALGLVTWLCWSPEAPIEAVPSMDAALPVLDLETMTAPAPRRAALAGGAPALPQADPALAWGQEGGSADQGLRLGVVLRLKEASDLQVEVRSAQGHTVKQLFLGRMEPGEHKIVWDGLGSLGQPVAAGDYKMVVKKGGAELERLFRLKLPGSTLRDVP